MIVDHLQCIDLIAAQIWVEDDEGTRDAPPSVVKLCAHTPWALSAKASRELSRMQVISEMSARQPLMCLCALDCPPLFASAS